MTRRVDIQTRQLRRSAIEIIKKELRDKDLASIDRRKLVLLIMSMFDCSRITARDYLDVALAELESEKAHE
jgi:hypothetical protein